MRAQASKPHVVLLVPRGESARNFLDSATLPALRRGARVTLLSVIHDERFRERYGGEGVAVEPLERAREHRLVTSLRTLIHAAHFRWLWSEVAKNLWETHDHRPKPPAEWLKWRLRKLLVRPLANRPTLRALTALDRRLSWVLRPDDRFVDLFRRLAPDLVFNTSHVHGPAAELPMKVAHRLGIPTAGFIFSWDNLTSRSRVFQPYDHYLVWTEGMARQLREIYPELAPERVIVTGTPQFDYHFEPRPRLSREELYERLGLDPARPFVLYTTGVDRHFPEEHRTVELVARLLAEIDLDPRPQLVVRTYSKGTSAEMTALAAAGLPDTVFPPVLWDERWHLPLPEDLEIYSGLLRHARLGVNAASTVSLELMMFDKPVINLGFDPPGSRLPRYQRYTRHLDFDHYRPVVESGAVMVARSAEGMARLLRRGLTAPEADSEARRRFLRRMFGDTLDGGAGRRVAETLLELARARPC